MRAQEVAKRVMKMSGITQTELSNRFGLKGQSTVSMILNGKSMKIENLLRILDECGYDLVAASRDGTKPDFVIGEEEKYVSRVDMEERMRAIAREAAAEAMRKEKNAPTIVAFEPVKTELV